jgi:hypothetical protein
VIVVHQLVTGVVHAVGNVGADLALGEFGAFGDADADGFVLVSGERDLGDTEEAGGKQPGAAQKGLSGVFVHVTVTDGLLGGHDVGRNLAVLDDLAPEGLAANLRLCGIGRGSHRARDIAEHGGQFIVVPGAEEESLAHVLVELVRHTAVGQCLNGSIRARNSHISDGIEHVIHVRPDVHHKVFRLELQVILSTAAQGIVGRGDRPEEMVVAHISVRVNIGRSYGEIEVIVDTGEHLLGVRRIHREVAAVFGPVVGRIEEDSQDANEKARAARAASFIIFFITLSFLDYLTIQTATRLDSGLREASRSPPTAWRMMRLAAMPAFLSISTTTEARCSERSRLISSLPVPLSA